MTQPTDVFIDTNILLYAYDSGEPNKQLKAQKCLKPFYTNNLSASISFQVLHELTHQLIRRKFDLESIRIIARPLLYWDVIEGTSKLYVSALGMIEEYQLSLWDALIVAAANQSGAKQLLTEDLNHGQTYDQVTAVNPFKD